MYDTGQVSFSDIVSLRPTQSVLKPCIFPAAVFIMACVA